MRGINKKIKIRKVSGWSIGITIVLAILFYLLQYKEEMNSGWSRILRTDTFCVKRWNKIYCIKNFEKNLKKLLTKSM